MSAYLQQPSLPSSGSKQDAHTPVTPTAQTVAAEEYNRLVQAVADLRTAILSGAFFQIVSTGTLPSLPPTSGSVFYFDPTGGASFALDTNGGPLILSLRRDSVQKAWIGADGTGSFNGMIVSGSTILSGSTTMNNVILVLSISGSTATIISAATGSFPLANINQLVSQVITVGSGAPTGFNVNVGAGGLRSAGSVFADGLSQAQQLNGTILTRGLSGSFGELKATGSLAISGSEFRGFSSTNSQQYTVLSTDRVVYFTNAAAVTATLPTAFNANNGLMLTLKDTSGVARTAGNALLVQASGGVSVIDNASTQVQWVGQTYGKVTYQAGFTGAWWTV